MPLTVDIDLGRDFTVAAGFDEVYAELSDVHASVHHFPKVRRLDALAPDTYRWEMERIGVGHISLQTVYACRYAVDRERGSVVWTPLAGVGNAQIGGSWRIARRDPGTALAFKVHGVIELPFPALMKAFVGTIAKSEFAALIDGYVANLKTRFGTAT
jgi:carbon monoxide dehydrogenase subunit G